MEPQGPPNEIPINIDPNLWQIVLRDGVATLVPKRHSQPTNATALVRTVGNYNVVQVPQGNIPLTQRAYEQALVLEYASQTTRELSIHPDACAHSLSLTKNQLYQSSNMGC